MEKTKQVLALTLSLAFLVAITTALFSQRLLQFPPEAVTCVFVFGLTGLFTRYHPDESAAGDRFRLDNAVALSLVLLGYALLDLISPAAEARLNGAYVVMALGAAFAIAWLATCVILAPRNEKTGARSRSVAHSFFLLIAADIAVALYLAYRFRNTSETIDIAWLVGVLVLGTAAACVQSIVLGFIKGLLALKSGTPRPPPWDGRLPLPRRPRGQAPEPPPGVLGRLGVRATPVART
jgi:hypothetical protein